MKIRNAAKSKQRRSSRTNFLIGATADTDWESDVDPLFSPQQGVEMGPMQAPAEGDAAPVRDILLQHSAFMCSEGLNASPTISMSLNEPLRV